MLTFANETVTTTNSTALEPRGPTVRRAPVSGDARHPNSASSTELAYARDVNLFRREGGTVPCDVASLKRYIWSMREKCKPVTLYRRAMAIRHAHVTQGLKSPTDHAAIRPLLRALQLGYAPDKKIMESGMVAGAQSAKRHKPRQSSPITRRLLAQMLEPLPRGLLDHRDRALVILGFVVALKRAELVAISVGDLRFTSDALVVKLTARGGEQDEPAASRARLIAVPITGGELCAATAVRTWIDMAALDAGSIEDPLFVRFDRGGDPTTDRLDAAYVNAIVKKLLKAIGIDPSSYSAQSLINGRRAERAKGML